MGEKSKLIGEYGEKSVENFLKLIGWGKADQNIEFSCTNSEHKKRTHGLDFFFCYKSPLVDNLLSKLNISVKFSDKPYKSNPNSQFKDYFEDLVTAIECFQKSEEYKDIISPIRNYSKSENIGVLFWLTNDNSSYDDLISKLSSVRISNEFKYDSLYIVDNKRIDFIYRCLKDSLSKYPNSDINFYYPDTGKNLLPTIKKDFGKILPVEYINTSILPLRIEDKQTKQTTLALFTIDPFEKQDLKRLIGLSKELCKSWTSKIIILFPDYNEVRHSRDVRVAKSFYEEETFVENISIETYNDDFKALQI